MAKYELRSEAQIPEVFVYSKDTYTSLLINRQNFDHSSRKKKRYLYFVFFVIITELIDCGRPEEHSTTQLQLFETGPGQVATYVCKEESPVLAAGNLTRTCLMIGEWDGQTPECMMHPGIF